MSNTKHESMRFNLILSENPLTNNYCNRIFEVSLPNTLPVSELANRWLINLINWIAKTIR